MVCTRFSTTCRWRPASTCTSLAFTTGPPQQLQVSAEQMLHQLIKLAHCKSSRLSCQNTQEIQLAACTRDHGVHLHLPTLSRARASRFDAHGHARNLGRSGSAQLPLAGRNASVPACGQVLFLRGYSLHHGLCNKSSAAVEEITITLRDLDHDLLTWPPLQPEAAAAHAHTYVGKRTRPITTWTKKTSRTSIEPTLQDIVLLPGQFACLVYHASSSWIWSAVSCKSSRISN